MTTIVEILGPSGKVHYTRLVTDPMIAEALATPGYAVRWPGCYDVKVLDQLPQGHLGRVTCPPEGLTLACEKDETPCQCRRCLRERGDEVILGMRLIVPVEMTRLILCQKCGNKRCPHATDHRHACTGSNEPGQPGSAYESCVPKPEPETGGPR